MIRGYLGWVGAGKTYSMVHDALEQFRETRCQVFTNMAGLKFPGAVYVEDLEAITRVGTGLVLIDEVGICMSSHYWQSVPRSVLMAFAQVRKNGLDVFWTAQHEARVDTVLRELTMEVRRCRRFGRYSFQSLEDPVAKVSLGKRLVKLKQEVFAAYDTLEIIGAHGGGAGTGQSEGACKCPAPYERTARSTGRRHAASRSR